MARGGIMTLLRVNRPFRLLWTARTISFLGDSLSLVALMIYVAGTTGEGLAVAVLLLVGDFAPSLLSPLTATVGDRFDLRRVMIGCELAQAALVAAIALTLPAMPVLLVLVGLRAVTGQVFQPPSRAAIPALVPDGELEHANSAVGFGTNGGEALGPLLAAGLLLVTDVRAVLLIDAASFVISAAVLSRLPGLPRAGVDADTSFLADAAAGLRYIWSAPAVRVIVLGFCAVVAFNGVDDVALVFLATDDLHAGPSSVGLLLAGVGVGLVIGYLAVARWSGKVSVVVLFLAGCALSSAGNVLTGLAWAVVAAFVLQTARGVGIAGIDVGATTLLQRLVPPAMQGRVFGNLYGAIGTAAGLSYVLGGVLLDHTSARVTLVVAGAGGLLATLITAIALRRKLGNAPQPV